MMYSYFNAIPLGLPLPLNNPHAVSVSLPTMDDVIGYEENKSEVKQKMQSGYPRFFVNQLVAKLCLYLKEKHQINESLEILPLMSINSLRIIQLEFGDIYNYLEEAGCVFILIDKNNSDLQVIKDFIRNTGLLLSSRKAEDILYSLGIISEKYNELISDSEKASELIKTKLCEAYQAKSSEYIFLCSSGMNAVYAVFKALGQFQIKKEKQTVIQAGWLYLDTTEIINKLSLKSISMKSVTDFSNLEQKIIENHQTISCIFTEVPNNPMLECVDLPKLYELCKKYEIALVVDCTIASAYNLSILPHCDVAIESLTKFACGQGDVLMGAVILNPQSSFTSQIKATISDFLVFPYFGDEKRLAKNMEGYENRVKIISENTKKVISYLEKSKAVSQLYSVLHKKSIDNFLKIAKHPDSIPGLISVVFDKELAFYYDKLNLPKGPSFGTEFMLAMPYFYLAHYDMVKNKEGREAMVKEGLHSELLRISIGVEPIEEIIKVYQNAGI